MSIQTGTVSFRSGKSALAVDLLAGRNRMVRLFRFMGGMYTNSLNHQGIKDLKAARTLPD
jgi:carboxymethylenebutenolidase